MSDNDSQSCKYTSFFLFVHYSVKFCSAKTDRTTRVRTYNTNCKQRKLSSPAHASKVGFFHTMLLGIGHKNERYHVQNNHEPVIGVDDSQQVQPCRCPHHHNLSIDIPTACCSIFQHQRSFDTQPAKRIFTQPAKHMIARALQRRKRRFIHSSFRNNRDPRKNVVPTGITCRKNFTSRAETAGSSTISPSIVLYFIRAVATFM